MRLHSRRRSSVNQTGTLSLLLYTNRHEQSAELVFTPFLTALYIFFSVRSISSSLGRRSFKNCPLHDNAWNRKKRELFYEHESTTHIYELVYTLKCC